MNRLTIITFKFSQPRKWRQLKFGLYKAAHVNALWRACTENIRIHHRFLCLTDEDEGIECETRPVWPAIFVNGEDACYRRLRAFDGEWQASLGSEFILCLDLDAVFLTDVTPIIEEAMQHDFTIMRGSAWPDGSLCSHYNGSMWLCRSGARPEFWSDFNPSSFHGERAAYQMPNGRRPLGSDQAWIAVKAGDSERTFGPDCGVYQYRSVREAIPPDARLLFFAGKQKPWGREVQRVNPEVFAAWKRYDSAVGPAEAPDEAVSVSI